MKPQIRSMRHGLKTSYDSMLYLLIEGELSSAGDTWNLIVDDQVDFLADFLVFIFSSQTDLGYVHDHATICSLDIGVRPACYKNRILASSRSRFR